VWKIVIISFESCSVVDLLNISIRS